MKLVPFPSRTLVLKILHPFLRVWDGRAGKACHIPGVTITGDEYERLEDWITTAMKVEIDKKVEETKHGIQS